VGLLAPGKHPPPPEEEISGDSPPSHSSSPGALTGTRAPSPVASCRRPVRSCCTGICRRPPARSSRPWRPIERPSGSASHAWAPGTWLADRCAQEGSPCVLDVAAPPPTLALPGERSPCRHSCAEDGRRAPSRVLGRRRPPHRRAATALSRARAPPDVGGAGRSRRHLPLAMQPAPASERRHRPPKPVDQLPLTG
jgi:hypothetical protein